MIRLILYLVDPRTPNRGWSTAALFPVPPGSYAPPRCHAPPEEGQGPGLGAPAAEKQATTPPVAAILLEAGAGAKQASKQAPAASLSLAPPT